MHLQQHCYIACMYQASHLTFMYMLPWTKLTLNSSQPMNCPLPSGTPYTTYLANTYQAQHTSAVILLAVLPTSKQHKSNEADKAGKLSSGIIHQLRKHAHASEKTHCSKSVLLFWTFH